MNVLNVIPMPTRSFYVPPPDPHLPVMLDEVLEAIAPRPGGVYVDATLGAGGHALGLLRTRDTTVIGIDRDRTALRIARERLARFGSRARCCHARFSELGSVLAAEGITRLDGLVADLGVSSMQLDDPARGMSFRAAGPIDMRMDQSEGETALGLIERLGDDDLGELIRRLGEERRARRVARCIRQALATGELGTTADLRRAVVRALGPARTVGLDPATRTFQALRIAVNDELGELTRLLDLAAALLASGGRIAVISFHSLEDRIVKRTLRAPAVWEPLSKKPVVASERERERNSRSRSAKLRAARRAARVPELPAEAES
ncbi:MAG: 16S rRNA (cytosine(1402)-N(4))-methyltransferase RsmH [Deltaproteobacteria bacterium]|nr:16S rRNA (cytosine(1402)-N(4))-methyltransferase RsmH [Deltaproteobacteria bacterium]